MLPLDLWQFGVIDFLEFKDQNKLVKCIDGLELTDLIGMKDLTDTKLKKYRYVTRLDATMNNNITDKGIKHLFLYALCVIGNNTITNQGIKHMNLKYISGSTDNGITDEGVKHMDIELFTLAY